MDQKQYNEFGTNIRKRILKIVNSIIARFNTSSSVEKQFHRGANGNDACRSILRIGGGNVSVGRWKSAVSLEHVKWLQHVCHDVSLAERYTNQMEENLDKVDVLLPRFMVQVLQQVAEQITFSSTERFKIDLGAIRDCDHKELDFLCNPMQAEDKDVKFEWLVARLVSDFIAALLPGILDYKAHRHGDIIYIVIKEYTNLDD